MNMHFKLISLREYLHLSRNAFAKRIGCSTTQFARYEEGVCQIPDRIIEKINSVFDVDPRYFYENMQVDVAVDKPEGKCKRNSEVAERLKTRRHELNLTQKELSDISGVSSSLNIPEWRSQSFRLIEPPRFRWREPVDPEKRAMPLYS